MGRLKRWFYHIYYSLPFAMKSADDIIFNSNNTSELKDSGIHRVIEENRVSVDLLKGEVTQQVEELRYRDYKVAREASRYSYNGDGTASKKEDGKFRHVRFSQNNRLDVHGIIDGEKSFKGETRNTYTLAIIYKNLPKFRLETFCKVFDVDTESCVLRLHFSSFPDKYDFKSKSFLNELEKTLSMSTIHDIERNEICSNIMSICFTTYKADGEDDMVRYNLHNISFDKIEKTPFEYIITYDFKHFEREDLLDKYYSPTMQAKYDNKELKKPNYDFEDEEIVYRCAQCGKIMNATDAKITKQTYNYPICQDCLKKLDLLEKNTII